MTPRQTFTFELMVICLLFLLFFRTGIALRVSGPFDEACYLAMAEHFIGLKSLGCEGKSHFPGIAFLWIPAAILGRGVAFLLKTSPHEWIAAFCGLSSFLFWVGTWRIIKELFKSFKISAPPWIPFIVLLNIPVFYYAFARNLLAHSGEVFIAFLYLLTLIRRKLVISIFLLLLLFLIRPNNWGAFLFMLPQINRAFQSADFKERKRALVMGTVLLLVVVLIFSIFIRFGLFTGYHGTFLIPTLLDWQPRSLIEFFFRTDHGVFWNQFVWTLVVVVSLFRFKVLSDSQVAALFWIMGSVSSAIFWPTYGSSFGYRYILGAYAPALFMCLEFLSLRRPLGHQAKKLITLALSVGAFWSLNLYWVSTAPPPLWPWTDPFLTQLTPPYGILSHWMNHTESMLKMLSFSSIWQIVQWFSGKEVLLNFDGARLPYFFEGTLNIFTLVLTFGFLIVFLFSAISFCRLKLSKK